MKLCCGNRFKNSLSKQRDHNPFQPATTKSPKNHHKLLLFLGLAFARPDLTQCLTAHRDSLKLTGKQLVRTAINTVNLNLYDIVSCCSRTQFQLVDRRAKPFFFFFLGTAKATLGINQNTNTKAKTTRNIKQQWQQLQVQAWQQ